ncbi:MAG: T9SS type A sorting domain-containing protein [Flavobacteriaceae bacterium]|nr:T9SS type A sorting domain-containing protein [Flavobacteriaceae bacterium]
MKTLHKQLTILLTFFLGTTLLFSQTNAEKELKEKLSKIHKILYSEPEKAFEEAKAIEKEAKKINAKQQELEAIELQCYYYGATKDFEKMLITGQALYQKAEKHKIPIYQVRAKRQTFEAYIFTDLPDKAFSELEQGSKIISKLDNNDPVVINEKIRLFSSYGNYYWTKGDFQNQLKYSQLAGEEMKKLPNEAYREQSLSYHYSNMAGFYADLRQMDSAKVYAELSQSKYKEEYNRNDVVSQNFWTLGKVAEHQKDYPKALSYFKKAEKKEGYKNHENLEILYDDIITTYQHLQQKDSVKVYQAKRDSLKLSIAESQKKSLTTLLNEKEEFTSYSGQTRKNIARINTDGTLDTSFTVGTGFSGSSNDYAYSISAICIQPDGKMLVGGAFSSYNGQSRNRIARLNIDGTIDTTFGIGTGFKIGAELGQIQTISLQPDGKILVGGWFTHYNGQSANSIIRLNTDGTMDNTFSIGTGFGGDAPFVDTVTIHPDGKILVGGWFETYNGQTRNRIIRLNTDGTVDTSFTIGTGFDNRVYSIAVQPDGKMLVGGAFSSYNGQSRNRIARLNIDGSIDTSFTIGTGFNSFVFDISMQPDGKILAGGWFTSYNGQTTNSIIRLNTDGTLDTSFDIGTGFSGGAFTIAIQSDGKILAGGEFTTYNGQSQNRIVRLHNNAGLGIDDNTINGIKIYPNPVKEMLYFSEEVNKITVTDLTGKVFKTQSNSNQVDLSNFQTGVYFVVIDQENGAKETKKVVKK